MEAGWVFTFASISERLLKRLREHFRGSKVSSLKDWPGQVWAADGRGLEAWDQTTDDLQATLQASHRCINFRVFFVVFPGSGDVVIIDSKTLREGFNADIEQTFHNGYRTLLNLLSTHILLLAFIKI